MDMRRLSLALSLFLLAQLLPAQVLTTTDVLATAANEPPVARQQSLISLANGLKVHDPLIRQVSAQVGINGSALGDTIFGYLRNEDTYRLRVEFNSLSQRRQQDSVHAARVARITAESRLLEHEALAWRYEALAGYLYLEPKLAALRRLDSLFEQEHRILREMLASGAFEVKVSKVVDLEEDQIRNRLDLEKLEVSRALQREHLLKLTGNFTDIDRRDLATAADLRTYVLSFGNRPPAHPALAVKNAEAQLEAARLGYINSQNRQVFSYLQSGYQRPLYLERPNRFNTFNNFNFRVGLDLPLPANNRYRRSAALLDLQEAQNSEAAEQEELQGELDECLARLASLFREYDLLQEQLDKSLIRQMLNNPVLLARLSPLEIVEMEIARQKLVVNLALLLSDLAEAYVEWLDVSGLLTTEPNVNFLKKRE